jgi:aminoglycoside N3'-acetyltransferase
VTIDRPALAGQLRALGVRDGAVLLVHTSYRAVRPVLGGPATLVDALRDAVGTRGTVVMPAWGDDADAPFDPASTPVSADLGVTAELFRQLPGARRSDHPFAFAAIGRDAAAIVADPLPLPPHGPASPVGRVHELNGQVLLLGVGHDANTTIHLAEALAGVPYNVPKHCTVLAHGRPARVEYTETDHCCERFALADAWLRERGLQREGAVGHGTARLAASRDIVTVVRRRLESEPLLFLHDADYGCRECDEARGVLPR